MIKAIEEFFRKENIEYYATLSYKDLRQSAPEIMKRESFSPKSVIIYLLPYYGGETVNLSRYAASLDYHLALREVNRGLSELILSHRPDAALKGYGDHSPIDERDAALKGGLGILGKNGLLINEKYGSYVFVGDLVTDIPPEELSATPARPYEFCSGCGACLKACPTGVLRGESLECLSAITQKKGELSDFEISLMRENNTVWGCDLCQSSCPHNKKPEITPIKFFRKDRIPCLTREILDNMDKESFEKRAVAWRKRKTVERNLELLKY